LFLVFAVLLAGSVTGPALAVGVSVQNVDRWAKHPALQPFNVSSKELPSSLFLVRTRGQLPETDGIVVHGTHNGLFLVSGNATAIRSLSQRGCFVMPLRDLPEAPRPIAREWVWIDAPDPAIVAMVDQVRWEGVRDKIQWLVRFGTRYSFAPNHHAVAQSIGNVFETYGLQATLRSFKFRAQYQREDSTMWNVEATQTGTAYPNSYVIICGHFDSMSPTPMQWAPGADDNATGTATVLTAAEILSQHAFEYSIRYICFGGEEQGIVGSNNYSRWARKNDLDIIGVLNFDMVGYWKPGIPRDLEIETNRASQWLAEAVVNAADLYTNAQYELHVEDHIAWGDHWSFLQRGYAAVNHEEFWDWADPDFNPHYHTVNDLLEDVDPGFTVGNIQVGVAALATLAGYVPPIPVSFDVRPGSCRNPFNPKSRGVVPALVLGSEEFDVHDLDVASLRIEGSVAPSTIRVADEGSASDNSGHPCADMYPDGIADLSLKFSTEDIAAMLGPFSKGDIVPLHLTGRLVDGSYIEGEDVVVIVGSDSGAPRAQETALPTTFVLHPNVPNPFNPTTTIRFDVPSSGGHVTLRIYDVRGRLVRTLVDDPQPPGERTATWSGRDDRGNAVGTGVYFYRLVAGDFVDTKKMVLLK
jgi:hypothetical protein